MKVRFWGTRGSLPVSLNAAQVKRKIVRTLSQALERGIRTPEALLEFIEHDLDFATGQTFGGQSPCVQLEWDTAQYIVLDMGSGARALGERIMAEQARGQPFTVHVFMSHMHWDHIMGFPFFAPAYSRDASLVIHGCHDELEHALRLQQSPPCFPVGFEQLSARIEFVHLTPGARHDIAGVSVLPMRQLHAGDSYGLRFERAGRSIVYSTDSEHKLDDPAEFAAFVEFFRDADLVIFDAMYSLADAVSVKEDWGHSSNMVGVEIAQTARARQLCLFHHEPASDDEQIESIHRDAVRFEELIRDDHELEVSVAYDGLEIEL